jgi:phosphate transport system protein
MPRDAFHQELATLDSLIRQMGDLDEQALSYALVALSTRDDTAVREALARERLINELQVTVRTRVTTAIALQAPVAGDLRDLTAVQLIGIELERIGDYARHVATHARHVLQEDSLPFRDAVVSLGEQAHTQLLAALECFSARDSDRARAISQADDTIDHAYRAVLTQLMAEMEHDPSHIVPLSELLFTAQAVERIGDRVTNICEDIIFMVTGNIEALN